MSKYKKLKKKYEAEIMELKKDIRILVEEKNWIQTAEVKLRWQYKFACSDLIWGTPTTTSFSPASAPGV